MNALDDVMNPRVRQAVVPEPFITQEQNQELRKALLKCATQLDKKAGRGVVKEYFRMSFDGGIIYSLSAFTKSKVITGFLQSIAQFGTRFMRTRFLVQMQRASEQPAAVTEEGRSTKTHRTPSTSHSAPATTTMQSPISNYHLPLQSPITDHRSPITDHRSPTTNHQPPTTNPQPLQITHPPSTYHLPLTTYHLPLTTYHQLVIGDR
jgi:hypothetical protein